MPTHSPRGGSVTVWRAVLPAATRAQLVDADGAPSQIQSLFVGGRRLWRARWPNADPTQPGIWGGGYVTASGGLGGFPCPFRSPDVSIDGRSCAVPGSAQRFYPGMPPTGATVPAAALSPRAGQWLSPRAGQWAGQWSLDRFGNASAAWQPPVVHVSTYARPPDQGSFGQPGYVWVQGNLQYTLGGIEPGAGAGADAGAQHAGTDMDADADTALHFEDGGQQVNSYSWVMGAANLANGSRLFVENAGLAELDAPGEFYDDVLSDAPALYVALPMGLPASVTSPGDTEIVVVLAKRVLDVRGGGSTGGGVRASSRDRRWASHLHFIGLEVAYTAPTFLDLYEAPGRGGSDWTIHRGGAVFLEGVRDVSVARCTLRAVGGNALFVSHAAQDVAITENEIGGDIGDSGVAIVGSLTRSTGLGALNYPRRVNVTRNRIHGMGVYGKQVTGVYVAVAGAVSVTDNTIHGSPSSGIKLDETFVGGHDVSYNDVYDVTREVTDMGAINLHSRDRFYVPGDSPVWNKNKKPGAGARASPWSSQFPAPYQRGPVAVDAVRPTTLRGNVLRTTRRSGAFGRPGDWWGTQGTLFCLDMDDGPTRYVVTENVCIANGTQGYKLGHDVDAIDYSNNILVSLATGWQSASASASAAGTAADTAALSIGAQNANNTNAFTRNVLVRLGSAGGGASADAQPRPWLVAAGFEPAAAARHPPYATHDYNLYFAAGGTVGVPPLNDGNRTAWAAAGLDRHSLFDVDPLVLNATPPLPGQAGGGAGGGGAGGGRGWPFGIRLAPGSPAFGLGFHNFAYGPRV
eukprot:g443.t1